MGNILRKKRPPSEELDELVLQIRELDAQLKQLFTDRAGALRWLNWFSIVVVGALSAFYWLQHGPLRKRLFSVASVCICGGLVFFLLRYLIVSIYDFFIAKKKRSIQFFTERKLNIIENVKETEKYNVAKELIKKYGGGADAELLADGSPNCRKNGQKRAKEEQQFALTSSNNGTPNNGRKMFPVQNNTPTPVPPKIPKLYEMQETLNRPMTPYRAPVRPFIEQSRTPVDRILDFLMGESINNRYALICSNCHSHNGMAFQEEFESISFFCFKCNYFNPSKNELKVRSLHLSPPPTGGTGLMPFRNFIGNENTDESTENEGGSERRPSTISLQSEDEPELLQQQQQHSSTTGNEE
uniref:Endoplasmic reticulum junction formation protein lunapark n=1 Tax=Globodera rostochiensis TaxID=31243 RepID=A0A914GZH1_GLORO